MGGSSGHRKAVAAASFDDLPERCFLSHSYRDSDAVADLCDRLPSSVKPKIFSRVDPDPTAAVSNGVIPTILECEGLVYLTGGWSERSFSVSFERDYALRSGLAVFA